MADEKKMITIEDKEGRERWKPAPSRELIEEIAEWNRSVEYWDMSQTHSCIYPM